MPLLTCQPSGRTVDLPSGTELLDGARRAGVEIASPCGGRGACGKCLVRVAEGNVAAESLGSLSRSAVADGYVLACRTKVLADDVTIEVSEQSGRDGGKFTDAAEDANLVGRELFPRDWQRDPLAVKWFLEVQEPQPEDGLSDLDRLTRALCREWGKAEVRVPLSVLTVMADVLRAAGGHVTVTLVHDDRSLHVVAVESGDTTAQHYGIAVDIGTTTIAVQLVYLPTAKVIATRSDYNGQIPCGLDVISRINYARRPGCRQELRTRVLKVINGLASKLCEDQGVACHEISNSLVSGNTTMVHLLLGLNPEYIRLSPYTPSVYEVPFFSAAQVGLEINPESWVSLSPCVGSYVGGDITAGLLCTDLATDTEEISLFIDIGTNGEIVVGNSEFLIACACSAGPAFEGGGIDSGMRAALGAIERVEVDAGTGVARYWTIGNVKPRGVCGSGMIALLAELFEKGWLNAAGRFDRSRPNPAISVFGRRARYTIAGADETEDATPIVVDEQDIDNIIRAKAAVYAACSQALDQVGLTFDDLGSIYIAGGFGRFLNLEQATILGLVPDLPRDRFHYIGNASLIGSHMALVSREFRERQLALTRRITYMELNTDPGYMDQYTGALFLPHTDPDRFPSVHARLGN